MTQTINTFTNPATGTSAHLVIAHDGTVTQLVPFNVIAHHAGQSYWEGLKDLNQHTIGIEIDNAGCLASYKRGQSMILFGEEIPEENIILATHKNDHREYGWEVFSPELVEVVLAISQALVKEYGLFDVLGHDDISPRRKWDPGPLFPMHKLHPRIEGKQTTQETEFKISEGTQLETIRLSDGQPGKLVYLPKDCEIEVLDKKLDAVKVYVKKSRWRNPRAKGKVGWISDRAYQRIFPK